MKKLSISAFSILAIIFAVSSAFTTAMKAARIETTYEIFNIYPDQATSCPSYPGPVYHQNLAAIFLNPIAATETINQWISSNSLSISDFCITADADQLCLVKFSAQDGVFANCLDIKFGDRIIQ